MNINVRPIMVLILSFILCVPKIVVGSDFLFNNSLFVGEIKTDVLVEELESVLSQNDFQISSSSEQIFEIYFDTPELHYLQQDGFVRYQAVQFLTKRKKKKKYHEIVQHTLNNIDDFFEVKHYNNVKSFEEKNALLGLVKRKQRDMFIAKAKSSGVIYPMRFKPVLQVSKTGNNYNLSYNNKGFMTIKVYGIDLNYLTEKTKLSMVEIAIDKAAISQFDENEKASIQLFYQAILDNVSMQKTTTSNEYKTFVMLLKNDNKYFDIYYQYPEIINFLYAVVMAFFGLIILSFFLVKRENYKTINS